MTTTDLHHLAVRFCDDDAMTRDVSADGALEYRLFLSRFLKWVESQQVEKVLQFEKREEKSDASGNAS